MADQALAETKEKKKPKRQVSAVDGTHERSSCELRIGSRLCTMPGPTSTEMQCACQPTGVPCFSSRALLTFRLASSCSLLHLGKGKKRGEGRGGAGRSNPGEVGKKLRERWRRRKGGGKEVHIHTDTDTHRHRHTDTDTHRHRHTDTQTQTHTFFVWHPCLLLFLLVSVVVNWIQQNTTFLFWTANCCKRRRRRKRRNVGGCCGWCFGFGAFGPHCLEKSAQHRGSQRLESPASPSPLNSLLTSLKLPSIFTSQSSVSTPPLFSGKKLTTKQVDEQGRAVSVQEQRDTKKAESARGNGRNPLHRTGRKQGLVRRRRGRSSAEDQDNDSVELGNEARSRIPGDTRQRSNQGRSAAVTATPRDAQNERRSSTTHSDGNGSDEAGDGADEDEVEAEPGTVSELDQLLASGPIQFNSLCVCVSVCVCMCVSLCVCLCLVVTASHVSRFLPSFLSSFPPVFNPIRSEAFLHWRQEMEEAP